MAIPIVDPAACVHCGKEAHLDYYNRCPDCAYGTHLVRVDAAWPAKPSSDTLEAAKSIIPLLAGDITAEKKAEYLSFRYTGFSFREAVEMTGVHPKTVYRWRHDKQFYALELQAAGEARHEIRKEVMHLLFVRNMHLKMRKDYAVLRRANKIDKDPDGQPLPLDPSDKEYLNKVAAYYTPQQLETVERLLSKELGNQFDFGSFVRTLQWERLVVQTKE